MNAVQAPVDLVQVADGLTELWRNVLYNTSVYTSERIGLANLLILHKLPALSSKQGVVLISMLPTNLDQCKDASSNVVHLDLLKQPRIMA